MKNNYVIFWGPQDYYRIAFSDFSKLSNVRYIDGIENIIGDKLYKFHIIHHSSKINSFISLPFRKVWRKYYFTPDFDDDNPSCFIFHGRYYWMKSIGYFDYLKEKYPGSKCIFLLWDTVDSYIKYYKGKSYGDFDIEYIKNTFDRVLTYNRLDSLNYGFEYYPSIYSNIDLSEISPSYDAFFIGKAKDRLDEIHHIYHSLTTKGFKCDFYVSGVEDLDQRYKETIHYNEFLSYKQVLDHIKNSKGIVEITQGGVDGFTFRLNEALISDKNLITNNSIVENMPYRNSRKIIKIQNIDTLTKDKFDQYYHESFNYKDDYSPIKFIEYLDKTI